MGTAIQRSFNQMANSNRRNNNIGSLNIDGVLTLDQEAIEEGIVWFYKSLYSEDSPIPLIWMCLIFPGFLRTRLAGWNDPLRKPSFFGVVMDFNGHKVLGHDGFPMVFFQTC